MARPPRYLWRIAFSNFINSLKPRASKEKLMGEDTLGNQYYESIPTEGSHFTKPRRWFTTIHGEGDGLQELPSEWEAWLRGRRKVPPSPEEIAKNYAMMIMKKKNALELEQARLAAKAVQSPEETKLLEASKILAASKSEEASSFPQYGKEFEFVPGVVESRKDGSK